MAPQPIAPTVPDDLQSRIRLLEQDTALLDAASFVAREDARRELESSIVHTLDRLIETADKGRRKRLRAVKREALRLRALFDQANEQLFDEFRTSIREHHYAPAEIAARLDGYVERAPREVWDDPPPYDHLDTFVDGILRVGLPPRPQRQADPEMVLYQPTPARTVLDLAERLRMGPDDVFYDLGSGLGRVPILVSLVSHARAVGVEIEPAYVDYARRRVKDLALARVEFANTDARDVNYGDGSVFFLYTPFKGKILQRVVELLRYEARHRRIRVCTYGPGTLELMEHGGFVAVEEAQPDIHRAAILEGA